MWENRQEYMSKHLVHKPKVELPKKKKKKKNSAQYYKNRERMQMWFITHSIELMRGVLKTEDCPYSINDET